MHNTRREVLTAIAGATVPGIAGCLGDDEQQSGPTWEPAVSPTNKTLYSVTMSRSGPYAVGESGRVLARSDVGWALVSKRGPAHDTNALYDVAATDNGRAVWFAGSSGAVGRYHVDRATLENFTAPKEKTSTWETVGVFGVDGDEWVALVNGSGELLRGRYGDGEVEWADPFEPGSGTTVEDVAFAANGFGYLCDSAGNVFATRGDGEWTEMGIEGTSDALFSVAPFGKQRAAAAAEDGIIFRYNGFEWTAQAVGTATLYAIDRRTQGGVAAGENGAIYELGVDGWQLNDRHASGTLHGATLGQRTIPAVVVGEAGAIIERRPNR